MQKREFVSPARPWLLVSCLLLAGSVAFSQTSPDKPSDDAHGSWTATSGQQGLAGNANSTRSTRSHNESGGRTFDRQSIETLGPDGHYVPYLDVERVSIQVDANTVRAIERTFARDPDGRRTLQQVTEEEQHNLGNGREKTTRTTSNPDINGRLQVVNREIQESQQLSPEVRESKTTVLAPDVNGGLEPSAMIQERYTKGKDQDRFRKSTLLPDGNGGWQAQEVQEGTIQTDGKEQTRDERVLRPDLNGKLAVTERTVTHQLQSDTGEGRENVETYSTSLPGNSEDGSLHLNQRVSRVQRARADGGKATVEQTEQRNPGAPEDSPRITQKAIDIVRPGVNGSRQERTVETVDTNGGQSVVWVDTQKSTKPSNVQVEMAAPAKPQ